MPAMNRSHGGRLYYVLHLTDVNWYVIISRSSKYVNYIDENG